MLSVNPYLNFDGNTEEAFLFYQSVFGGEFATFQRFSDVPGQEPIRGEESRIMHISLPIGKDCLLMASDTSSAHGKMTAGNNFHISLNTSSQAEADQVFKGLSTGGQVNMPLEKMFWGAYFGMCTDPFGIQWMVSYEEKK